eukprot:TRINITY_DN7875_c0_g3_i1.p1 TRINITY_DN7875_c0_g3~~TRINITY_DN7875_c0_g3_i1.p1  ORF type:complete len:499 (+),score=56.52 TRINITY_DN7875_c0_g3_i1:752-2248(+)
MFLKIADCTMQDQEDAAECSFENILCLNIRASSLPGSLGGLVSNLLVSPGLLLLHFLIAAAWYVRYGGNVPPLCASGGGNMFSHLRRMTWLDAQGTARFPSFSVWPMLLVFQATLDHGATLVLYSGDRGAVAGSFAIVISITTLCLILLRTWQMPAATTPAEPGLQPWIKFIFGSQYWDSRLSGDPTFVPRWALVFKDYNEAHRWFLAVEIVLMQALALLNAWRPQARSLCTTRTILVCVALLIYLVVLLWRRPFLAPLDLWHLVAVTLCQVAGLVLIVLALSHEPSEGWAGQGSAVLLVCSSALVALKGVFDASIWVLERLQERTQGKPPRRRWVLDNRRPATGSPPMRLRPQRRPPVSDLSFELDSEPSSSFPPQSSYSTCPPAFPSELAQLPSAGSRLYESSRGTRIRSGTSLAPLERELGLSPLTPRPSRFSSDVQPRTPRVRTGRETPPSRVRRAKSVAAPTGRRRRKRGTQSPMSPEEERSFNIPVARTEIV